MTRLATYLPEPVTQVRVINTGWTHLVYEINGRWIGRFARFDPQPQLTLEAAFLAEFAPVAFLPIPEPVYAEPAWMIYPKIVGEPLKPNLMESSSPAQWSLLAQELGRFLAVLHQQTFTHPHLARAPYGGQDFWTELWPVVAPLLPTAVLVRAEAYFKTAVSQFERPPVPVTLIHADFGSNNVLIHPLTLRAAGVIDFGDLSIGDPAVDFATFYRRLKRPFVEQMVAGYTLPLGPHFWERVAYQARRKPFFVAYFARRYGYEAEIPQLVAYIATLFDDESHD